MKKIILLFILSFQICDAQVTLELNWCKSKCNAAGDEMKNTKQLFMDMRAQSKKKGISNRSDFTTIKFPIRFGFVSQNPDVKATMKSRAQNAIQVLNEGFASTNIEFELDDVDYINSSLMIEDLSANAYDIYDTFSAEHDKEDRISIFVFDYDPHLCDVTANSIRCGRTGGFSYILSELTNNIVLSSFDLEDYKIIVHEMGHFFGLYHTFEEVQFGKDDFNGDCNILGDCICDTPPDPGPAYEVYVNFSTCEMIGFLDENDNLYTPIINNYMTYFKPCYLKEYSFTPQQQEVLRYAAQSDFRAKFSN